MSFNEYQAQLQQLLLKIPKGKITTYKALAEAMNIRGYRFVGQLLNKNPEPEKYPCYKVVNTNGALGGFALGCEDKIKRLQKDGIQVVDGHIQNFKHKLFTYEN